MHKLIDKNELTDGSLLEIVDIANECLQTLNDAEEQFVEQAEIEQANTVLNYLADGIRIVKQVITGEISNDDANDLLDELDNREEKEWWQN